MQLVTDGLLKASFLYPTGGEEAIETAVQVLAGKAVRRETTLNSIQIDAVQRPGPSKPRATNSSASSRILKSKASESTN